MAQFDESKVINALHTEKAKIGKKYWFSDSIAHLKSSVEQNLTNVFVLGSINYCGNYPFETKEESSRVKQFIYPYEEPSKQRMTNIQLMEWLNKGKGLILIQDKMGISNSFLCCKDELNNEVDKDILIHSWYSDDFIEPTVDIYERDCKGGKE